jgi:hypothetical protein
MAAGRGPAEISRERGGGIVTFATDKPVVPVAVIRKGY